MFALNKTASLPLAQASQEDDRIRNFLKALQSMKGADLKQPYELKEFEGGLSFRDGKFRIGGKEVSPGDVVARAEREGARLRPYLTGEYEPGQFSVLVTAASLGQSVNASPQAASQKLDLTDLQIGLPLVVLNIKFGDLVMSRGDLRQSGEGKIGEFVSDNKIDDSEIDAVEKGGWVPLMPQFYEMLSSAPKPAKVSLSDLLNIKHLAMPAHMRPIGHKDGQPNYNPDQ